MFDRLKSKMFFHFFENSKESSYDLIDGIEGREVIYRKIDYFVGDSAIEQLVVLVEDPELGKQIFKIVKSLKEKSLIMTAYRRTYPRNQKVDFEIFDYYTDGDNRIKAFRVRTKKIEQSFYGVGILGRKIAELKQLIAYVELVESMRENGYYLKSSRFECEKCRSLASFLSFFEMDEEDESYKGCLIEYLHYLLYNEDNLKQYYQDIVEKKEIIPVEDFPYGFPIIKMCWEYWKTGSFKGDICQVLQEELARVENTQIGHQDYYSGCFLIVNKDFSASREIIEKTDEYTVYEGNIKIYENMPEGFEEFLKDPLEGYERNRTEVEEDISKILIDYNGNIVGYEFGYRGKQGKQLDTSDSNSIIKYLKKAEEYLFALQEDLMQNSLTEKFSIETGLISVDTMSIFLYDYCFRINKVRDLFELANTSKEEIEKQITTKFLHLYLDFLNKKYGKMNTEEEFLSKKEVRYLSPALANSFIKFALGKEIEISVVTEQLEKFFRFLKSNDCYYGGFEYDPSEVSFSFDYEVERQYHFKLEKGMKKTLSDGRELVILNNMCNIAELKKHEDDMRDKYITQIGNIPKLGASHGYLVEISHVIYSREISEEGMYKVIGYITTPKRGTRVTRERLLGLNNKEIYEVIGLFFSVFEKYYIPYQFIYMDKDFYFYIDILDMNFEIKKVKGEKTYIEWMIDDLIEHGYNPNAFYGMAPKDARLWYVRVSNYNSYCEEHGIYYEDEKHLCPVCQITKFVVETSKIAEKIWEDKLAIHYSLKDGYNLKVYRKPTNTLEKHINEMMECHIQKQDLKIGQDCFVPAKKALNEDGQFIGYIYKAFDFEDKVNCNELRNQRDLRNLPRLMGLIRLMCQVKEITQNHSWSFSQNPYGAVFLSKQHKRQVQICNVDLLSKEGNVEDTLKWTCEYVCKTIALDYALPIDISDCHDNFEGLLKKLQSASKRFTNYCHIHQMYYQDDMLFCPKCVGNINEFKKSVSIERVNESKITSKQPINGGGESFIYDYAKDVVAKVFKKDVVDLNFKKQVLAHIMKKKKNLARINAEGRKFKYMIPQKLLQDKTTNEIFAYTMKKVVGGMPLSNLRDVTEVEKLGFKLEDILEILITVGEGIEILHENNIYIGDLNGRNILFDNKKRVYFLEFDGMGVDEIMPMFCTDGYIDPISKKNQNITMKDDWYSFAIQAFHYLTYTHPFNGIYKEWRNGNKVILTIPERMERRISLLGNYGIEIPSIAREWDWMEPGLWRAFLDTFEGDRRESIVPYLKREYQILVGGSKMEQKPKDKQVEIRINSNFIARKQMVFDGNVEQVINHYAAICSKDNVNYVEVLVGDGKKIKINRVPGGFDMLEIKDIQLTQKKDIAWLVFEDKMVLVNLKSEPVSGIFIEEEMKNITVDGNSLYFIEISDDGKETIYQRTVTPEADLKREKIRFMPENKTKAFLAKFDSKFVIVKEISESRDAIFCNSEKLCDFRYYSTSREYNIIYDEGSKTWLVISNEGTAIVIKADGKYLQLDIKVAEVANVSYKNGILYIPEKDCLQIIKISKDGSLITKTMECPNIITPSSKLYNINSKGFGVITDNIFYEVRKEVEASECAS